MVAEGQRWSSWGSGLEHKVGDAHSSRHSTGRPAFVPKSESKGPRMRFHAPARRYDAVSSASEIDGYLIDLDGTMCAPVTLAPPAPHPTPVSRASLHPPPRNLVSMRAQTENGGRGLLSTNTPGHRLGGPE